MDVQCSNSFSESYSLKNNLKICWLSRSAKVGRWINRARGKSFKILNSKTHKIIAKLLQTYFYKGYRKTWIDSRQEVEHALYPRLLTTLVVLPSEWEEQGRELIEHRNFVSFTVLHNWCNIGLANRRCMVSKKITIAWKISEQEWAQQGYSAHAKLLNCSNSIKVYFNVNSLNAVFWKCSSKTHQ